MTILTWENILGLMSLGFLLGIVAGCYVGWMLGFQAGESHADEVPTEPPLEWPWVERGWEVNKDGKFTPFKRESK